MSTHFAKTYAAGAKSKARRRAAIIAGAVAAFVAAAGVAFAAIALQSNEAQADLAAGTTVPLVLDQAQFTGPLYPGMSTGLKFHIKNDNPFPAAITAIALNGTSSTTCSLAQLTGPGAEIGTVENLTLSLKTPIVVDAGGEKTVEYPKVVSLSKNALASCAITAKFKVTGSGAGSGN